MSIYIDNDDPKISKIDKITIPLMIHQASSIYRMRSMEDSHITKIDWDCRNIDDLYIWTDSRDSFKHHPTHFKMTCGILGNPVGTGKSLIILGLIADKPVLEIKKDITLKPTNLRGPYFTFYRDTQIQNLKINSNMIVVPHNVIGQWGNYLEYQTNLTFFEVCSKNDIECAKVRVVWSA